MTMAGTKMTEADTNSKQPRYHFAKPLYQPANFESNNRHAISRWRRQRCSLRDRWAIFCLSPRMASRL